MSDLLLLWRHISEPEILVIDEVLAVGDAQFQKKNAWERWNPVSKNEGRTVLFVSHNIGIIQQLCKSGILLNKGQLIQHGKIKDVVNAYVSSDISVNKYEINNEPVDKRIYFKKDCHH